MDVEVGSDEDAQWRNVENLVQENGNEHEYENSRTSSKCFTLNHIYNDTLLVDRYLLRDLLAYLLTCHTYFMFLTS